MKAKTPYAVAVKKFEKSDEFKTLTDGKTLNLPPEMQKYLENRIRIAFDEGWHLALSMSEIISIK